MTMGRNPFYQRLVRISLSALGIFSLVMTVQICAMAQYRPMHEKPKTHSNSIQTRQSINNNAGINNNVGANDGTGSGTTETGQTSGSLSLDIKTGNNVASQNTDITNSWTPDTIGYVSITDPLLALRPELPRNARRYLTSTEKLYGTKISFRYTTAPRGTYVKYYSEDGQLDSIEAHFN